MSEQEEIYKRYERRKNIPPGRYSFLNPAVYLSEEEKERALIRWIKYAGIEPLSDKKLLEIGCGSGNNLLQFLRLGFLSENLVGNDLIPERIDSARERLPKGLKLLKNNALDLEFDSSSFDIVFQSMVFSSILENEFQNKLALKMWELVKPGGGILWYDFIYDNPQNSDVKGVSFKRVKELFPQGEIKKWRVTLPPPVARIVTKIHPGMYPLLNIFPFLRSHILCWIFKKS